MVVSYTPVQITVMHVKIIKLAKFKAIHTNKLQAQ